MALTHALKLMMLLLYDIPYAALGDNTVLHITTPYAELSVQVIGLLVVSSCSGVDLTFMMHQLEMTIAVNAATINTNTPIVALAITAVSLPVMAPLDLRYTV